jgi:hypothetical protein
MPTAMRRWCGSGDWPGSEICKSAMKFCVLRVAPALWLRGLGRKGLASIVPVDRLARSMSSAKRSMNIRALTCCAAAAGKSCLIEQLRARASASLRPV